MALAKYLEDITERWLENTKARYEDRLKELFERFPASVSSAGEVYLTRHGRRMEDIEVCEVGQTLHLAMVIKEGAAASKCEIEVDGRWQEVSVMSGQTMTLSLPVAAQRQLRVISAGYLKEYTLHVIQAMRVESQPDFARFIRELSDNPPNWSDITFADFRRQLQAILVANNAPQMFIDGVIEYHMALFHEDLRLANFRDRLQSAYGNLRWFIPYSDIARLICIHYLYCANEFEAALNLCGSGSTRMRQALALLLSRPLEEARSIEISKQGLPLLVSLSDSLLFEAAQAIREGRHESALVLCAAVHRQLQPAFDRERAERLACLEAIARAGDGDAESARSRWEVLLNSPWRAIAETAKQQLSLLPNGSN